jgi:hypothetical protein
VNAIERPSAFHVPEGGKSTTPLASYVPSARSASSASAAAHVAAYERPVSNGFAGRNVARFHPKAGVGPFAGESIAVVERPPAQTTVMLPPFVVRVPRRPRWAARSLAENPSAGFS